MNQTETPLAHHTFTPWTVDGDRRVVAAEHEWDEMLKIDEEARLREGRTRVMVDVDVFEDYEHVMRNEDEMEDWGQSVIGVTMSDTRDRLFRLIDRTPSLDWMIVTSQTENVSAMMPNHCPDGRKGCEVLHVRSNLWLGVRVSNQAEADSRIPQLLRVPTAVRFVHCTPLCEIDFSEWMYTIEVVHNGDGDTQEIPCKPPLDWITCSGESGPDARPMHPDWVRSLRDQCQAAGIAFRFESWGDWVEVNSILTFTDNASNKIEQVWITNSGHVTRYDPDDLDAVPMKGDGRWMARVGSDRSGRLLDGREWNELPNQNQEPQS